MSLLPQNLVGRRLVTQRDANGNRVYSPRDGSAKLRSVQKVNLIERCF